MTSLLHPEYLDKIPLVGKLLKQRLDNLSKEAISAQSSKGKISIAIRTLNEEKALGFLLDDVRKQKFNGPIDIVVVDNESTDRTVEVAKQFGARVIDMPRDSFTYPRSMNLAMEAAKHDLVFLTVGHTRLISVHSLQAGYDILQDTRITGVFGRALPGANASLVERIIAVGNVHYSKIQNIRKPGLGVMAATGSMLNKRTWEELGKFDERFQQGGEDGALATKMLQKGYKIIEHPLLGTHHTHGLGLVNTVRQWRGWTKLGKPSTFNKKDLAQRRPDLNLHNK